MAGFLIYHEMLVDSFPLPPKKSAFCGIRVSVRLLIYRRLNDPWKKRQDRTLPALHCVMNTVLS